MHPPPKAETLAVRCLRAAGLSLMISRLHIVAIGALGTFTFGWIFFGRYPWLLAAVCALDWFLVNILNRVVDREEDLHNQIPGTAFVSRHRRGITALGLALLGGSLVGLHLVLPAITPLRAAYHLLGLAYNWPLLPGGRRIKQLYFFKNTASTTGFLITVFGYPLAAGGGLAPDVSWATVLWAGLFFFPFEMSYEVIYDLRDAPGDARAGIRSYPVVHGLRAAMRITDGLILSSMAVLGLGYGLGLLPWRVMIMIFAPAIQLVFYRRAVRRGITTRDCVLLTWLGVALLITYHLWVVFDLPGAQLP
jgi:4-hydroxybenzoate polyprenyltransferase